MVGQGENTDVPTIDIASTEITFTGNLVGSYSDLSDLMALAARRLVTLPTPKYALDDFQSAIDYRVGGRAILSPRSRPLIFITAKFPVQPEHADSWPDLSREFTVATRREEGCLWFEWSRSLDDPTVYVLVEAFRDDDAGAAHVKSAHFAKATSELPAYLARTPDIVNFTVEGTSWSELGEMAVR